MTHAVLIVASVAAVLLIVVIVLDFLQKTGIRR